MSRTARRDALASIAGSCDRPARQLEMSVADRRREGDRATQQRIGLLVILNERLAFGRHRGHTVGGTAIRLQLRLERPGQFLFVGRPEHVEQIRDRLIDDGPLARQDGGATLIAGEDEQDGIILAFERPRQLRGDGRHGFAVPDRIGDHSAETRQGGQRPHARDDGRADQQHRGDAEPKHADPRASCRLRPDQIVSVFVGAWSHRCPVFGPPLPATTTARRSARCARVPVRPGRSVRRRARRGRLVLPDRTRHLAASQDRAVRRRGPDARITARSTALRSSRRLPGQGCDTIACSASAENVNASRPCLRLNIAR